MDKGCHEWILQVAKRLCEGDQFGTCPKCKSLMVRSNLNANSLLTIPFPTLVKYSWVCVRCHEIIGCENNWEDLYKSFPLPVRHTSIPDDITFDKPADKVQLPYETSAIKWLWLRRDECKLVIDNNGLTFTDLDDSKHSYHLSPLQLQRATFKQMGNVATAIRLSNGAKYEIAYEKKHYETKHDEIMSAIRLVITGS